MENVDDDPYASLIIPYCKPTSSQEEKLQICPFDHESEVFPGYTQSSSATDKTSEQASGIIMLSLSYSSEDYQTPPEQHSHSQNSVNDIQVLPSVHRKVKEGSGGDGEAMAVDDGCEQEGQRTVDLAKDSDNLGFSEKIHMVLVEDNDTVMIDDSDTYQVDTANGINEVKAETEYVIRDDPAELTALPTENTHEAFVEMPLRYQEQNTSTRKFSKKNIEDIDKFRFVGAKGKRQLPFSMKGQEKSSKEEGGYRRHRALMDVMNHALKLLVGEAKGGDDGDPDFIETAKRRGLSFPRPRWWPPEVFED